MVVLRSILKTTSESVQNVTDVGFHDSPVTACSARRVASRATVNSNRGMEVCSNGEIRAMPYRNEQLSIPQCDKNLQYHEQTEKHRQNSVDAKSLVVWYMELSVSVQSFLIAF